jgi:demethylmenaquinone methyltransferase/2-methoxy-6-polyprenyl-1,4-benzoquinol methylase
MLFRRRRNPYRALLAMIGIKEADHVAHVGCPGDPGRFAAIANHVGASGSVVVMVPDRTSAHRTREAATAARVPVEVQVVPLIRLPRPEASFDAVVVDDTADLFESIQPERRRSALGEMFRILRPGGRVIVISRQPRGGMMGALIAQASRPLVDDLRRWLPAEGFEAVRQRTAPTELALTEGVKPLS